VDYLKNTYEIKNKKGDTFFLESVDLDENSIASNKVLNNIAICSES